MVVLGRAVRDRRGGFTVIELVMILGLIGILATIAVLIYGDITERTRVAKAMADIVTLDSEISTFEMMNERLPNDLAEINRATFLDPWGNPYQYLNFAISGNANCRKDHALHPLNTEFDLYSMGKDGQSQPPLTASKSRDDIIRANDGQYVGLAANF
jgi:general secretion pathway protein G